MQASHGLRGFDALRDAVVTWLGPADERRSLVRVALYALATRLLFVVIVHQVVHHAGPVLHPRARHDFGSASVLAAWLRWDTWWYVSIVEKGYSFTPGYASNVAFLPGYPGLIALLHTVIRDVPLAALAASNLAFAASVVVLWSWVRDRAGAPAAERSAITLLLFPASFFMNVPYAEAPFFLLCLLSLRSADSDRWGAAGSYAALAALTRPTGVFLGIAFAWEYWRRHRVGRAPRGGVLAIALPLAALIPYLAYLWLAHGTPFAFLLAQDAGWAVGSSLGLFQLPFRKDYDVATLDVITLAIPFLLAVLVARAFRKLGPVSGVYGVLAAALGILLGGESLCREALAVVPAFAVSGIGERPGVLRAAWIASGLLLLIFVYGFAMGHFMG